MQAKLEKLRKVAAGEIHNRDKHSFSDPAYDKARSEVEEKVTTSPPLALCYVLLSVLLVLVFLLFLLLLLLLPQVHDAVEAAMAAGGERSLQEAGRDDLKRKGRLEH